MKEFPRLRIGDFCGRIQPTLDVLTFQQRRQLVTLLIDRVIVDDEKVEIRYVIPTSPHEPRYLSLLILKVLQVLFMAIKLVAHPVTTCRRADG